MECSACKSKICLCMLAPDCDLEDVLDHMEYNPKEFLVHNCEALWEARDLWDHLVVDAADIDKSLKRITLWRNLPVKSAAKR
jgi:hypothetical protein